MHTTIALFFKIFIKDFQITLVYKTSYWCADERPLIQILFLPRIFECFGKINFLEEESKTIRTMY